jgi:hypothetical protein
VSYGGGAPGNDYEQTSKHYSQGIQLPNINTGGSPSNYQDSSLIKGLAAYRNKRGSIG